MIISAIPMAAKNIPVKMSMVIYRAAPSRFCRKEVVVFFSLFIMPGGNRGLEIHCFPGNTALSPYFYICVNDYPGLFQGNLPELYKIQIAYLHIIGSNGLGGTAPPHHKSPTLLKISNALTLNIHKIQIIAISIINLIGVNASTVLVHLSHSDFLGHYLH